MNNQDLVPRPHNAIWIVVLVLVLLCSVFVNGQKESRGARHHYEKGIELLEKQELDQAIAELLAATKLNPKLVNAYNLSLIHI